MGRESFEIKTNDGKVTIRTLENSPMDAVSRAVDLGMLETGDTGSVAPVRELPNSPTLTTEEK